MSDENKTGGPENEPRPANDMPPPSREAELEVELKKVKDQLLRAVADAENGRRRAERERDDAKRYGAVGLARDVLQISDNLRRALELVPAEARKASEVLDALMVGLEATEREVLAAFEKNGIRKVMPLGERFDYNLHQAMFEAENTGKPAGTVVQVMQPGYVLHDRLLRPAMVGVAKGQPTDQSPVDRVDERA
ncbi:MAG: nucleotide exchange factor GrpE [Alphaproteobacteria bacterium]|nr:nucleotide exchange factor GrpE [Alphaproteobacteria bacterium]